LLTPLAGSMRTSGDRSTRSVDLKLLQVLQRVRPGASNPKQQYNHNVASVHLIPKLASGSREYERG
jgi:hypothetical protein